MIRNHDSLLRNLFYVVWPMLLVVLVVLVLEVFVGRGGVADVNTWQVVQSILAECKEPQCADYLSVSRQHAIVSFGAAIFLLFNALSFIFSVQKITQAMTKSGVDSDSTRNMALIFRVFAIIPTLLWSFKIVTLRGNWGGIYADEYLVLATFGLCAIADASIVAVLWKQKDGPLWLENREIIGALCYIDIPTLIGVSAIVWYGHLFESEWVNHTDLAGHEPILKAMSGGALIIHVVTSQIILSFLTAQVRFNTWQETHWHSRRRVR